MVSEVSKQRNRGGLYVHPLTGRQIVLQEHPLFGTADMDAYVRVGYVRVADAPAEGLSSKFARKIDSAVEEQAAAQAESSSPVTVELDAVSRKQLEAQAAELGIEDAANNKKYPNKQALYDAIEAARKETNNG